MGQLPGNVGLVYSKENMLRNIVSYYYYCCQDLEWSTKAPSLVLGTTSLQHIVVAYGPLKTESVTNKIAKYPGLNRNQNNDNAVKERMGH